jgi:hypothetical protein
MDGPCFVKQSVTTVHDKGHLEPVSLAAAPSGEQYPPPAAIL